MLLFAPSSKQHRPRPTTNSNININIASITTNTNTNINTNKLIKININTTTTMSSSQPGALAVPEPVKARNEIASSQASYTSADADKTDVEQGDIADLEKERRQDGEKGEKSDLERDIDIEATAETKETVLAADEAEDDDDDYPKGAKLASIVLALCLSIFLMSLDFVRANF